MPISMNYIVKRVFTAIAIIFGILVLTYTLIYIAPGNPAYVWAGRPRGIYAEKAIENAVKELGLDKPLWMQIYMYVTRFFSGDWGVSLRFKQPVLNVVTRNMAASLELLLYSYLISTPLGIFLGVYSALYRDRVLGKSLYAFMSIAISIPRFWIAIVLSLVFQSMNINVFGRIDPKYAVELNVVTGLYTIDSLISGRLDIFVDVLIRLMLPAIIVALYPASIIGRVIRFNLAESLYEEYVRQAISFGIKRSSVIYRYALRGVIPSVVQIFGMMFAYSIIDAATVEGIFGREGIGSAIVKAIPYNDYPLIIGLMSTVAIVFIVVNTVADLVQALIDPRVRL